MKNSIQFEMSQGRKFTEDMLEQHFRGRFASVRFNKKMLDMTMRSERMDGDLVLNRLDRRGQRSVDQWRGINCHVMIFCRTALNLHISL